MQAVVQMRNKGVSDHMIIDELTKQGYASIDIFEALTQADNQSEPVVQPNMAMQQPQSNAFRTPMTNEPPPRKEEEPFWNPPPQKTTVEAPNPQPSSPFQRPLPPPQQQETRRMESPEIMSDMNFQDNNAFSQAQSQNPFPARMQQYSQPEQTASLDSYADKLDEIAEAIIDEKWKELRGYVEKMVEWKSKVESRILKIESETKMIRDEIIALQRGMMDKVQTYDRHITDVATEIKAMERVFQKIIPSLTENVTELSRVVNQMKGSDETE